MKHNFQPACVFSDDGGETIHESPEHKLDVEGYCYICGMNFNEEETNENYDYKTDPNVWIVL